MGKCKISYKNIVYIIFLLLVGKLFSAEPLSDDLNQIYYFPMSFGLSSELLFSVSDPVFNYHVFDISSDIKIPLKSMPILQPSLEIGITAYNVREGSGGAADYSLQSSDNLLQELYIQGPGDLSHFDVCALGGLGLGIRTSRYLEFGGQLSGGLALSYYRGLVSGRINSGYSGDLNSIVQGGLFISFSPVFNFTININGRLKYLKTFGYLNIFDGLYLGLGLSTSFRLGDDPYEYRYLTLDDFTIPPLFAGLQPYYAKNQIVSVLIQNRSDSDLENLQVTFFQKGYMDSPTQASGADKLKKGEKAIIGINAIFNDNVFTIEGACPMAGEICFTYNANGRKMEQKKPVSYTLYDKSAIVWDDDRKAAAYITPSDSILKKFTQIIHQECADQVKSGYNLPLQLAIEIYLGIQNSHFVYQPDAIRPFEEVRQRKYLVDSIALPRQTLMSQSGDCDDLTVFYCSLLESIGVETGFITLADHIIPVFNSGTNIESCQEILPIRNMFIEINDEAWVPVEITMLGDGCFRDAWQKGIAQYAKAKNDDDLQIYLTKSCWKIYKPLVLKESKDEPEFENIKNLKNSFNQNLLKLVSEVLDYTGKDLRTKEEYNQFALKCMKLGAYAEAERALKSAILMDEDYLLPVVNLGNLSFMKKDFKQSLLYYIKAEGPFENTEGLTTQYVYLLLNMSVVYFYLENIEQARNYFNKARMVNPAITKKNLYAEFGNRLKNDLISRNSLQIDLANEIYFFE
ncbi:MAG: hypothetical protein JXR70_17130 [Spirochaetales bacterium]|nr:hypothetical protein [Spirochaetales bacterium]